MTLNRHKTCKGGTRLIDGENTSIILVYYTFAINTLDIPTHNKPLLRSNLWKNVFFLSTKIIRMKITAVQTIKSRREFKH